jgi:hypothetical protein
MTSETIRIGAVRYEVEPAFYIEFKERKKIYLVFDTRKDEYIQLKDFRIRLPRVVFKTKHRRSEVQTFFAEMMISDNDWQFIPSRIISIEEARFYFGIKYN